MSAITTVEIVDAALQPGARVRRKASFMGRDLDWTTEVEAVHFPHVLKLKIADGPFTGTVSYQIQRSAGGSTVRIHNQGETTKCGFLPASLVEAPMRSALAADLAPQGPRREEQQLNHCRRVQRVPRGLARSEPRHRRRPGGDRLPGAERGDLGNFLALHLKDQAPGATAAAAVLQAAKYVGVIAFAKNLLRASATSSAVASRTAWVPASHWPFPPRPWRSGSS
jgi:hypothetical protein